VGVEPDDPRQHFHLAAGTRLADFVTSNRETDIIEGPIGSGKTVALCLRVMRHAQEQRPSPIDGLRYTRFALVRNSYPDLRRTTIRTWLDTFPESLYGRFNWGQPPCHKISFADVRTEIDFLALDKPDDVRKLRSAEYTGIAYNELSFIDKALFDEGTSRLRYPKQEHGGPTWKGVIADSNAPDEDHWLAMMTGQVDLPPGLTVEEQDELRWPEEWGFHLQPPALIEQYDQRGHVKGYRINPDAENLSNLPAGYYEKQLAGKSKAWIDSRLMVRVVLVVEGSPVWPMFRRDFHVSAEPLRPLKGAEVLVSLDFGRVYPAALFSQEINGRVNVQHEMLGFNEGATIFAPKVKRFLEQNYPGSKVRLVGDPKGADRGQATERSAYDVFATRGMPVVAAPIKQNKISERIETVAYALNDNPSGVSRVIISPLCRTLIIGMAGRYHLVREEDGELRPKKDKYSNLCDCLQYKLISLGDGRRMMGLDATISSTPVVLKRGGGARRRVA
jgi:hypothetical protein